MISRRVRRSQCPDVPLLSMSEFGDSCLSIVSTVKERSAYHDGPHVELSLIEEPIPRPGKNEVLVRVEATPINPSDLGGFLAGMDKATAAATTDPTNGNPIIRGSITREAFAALARALPAACSVLCSVL